MAARDVGAIAQDLLLWDAINLLFAQVTQCLLHGDDAVGMLPRQNRRTGDKHIITPIVQPRFVAPNPNAQNTFRPVAVHRVTECFVATSPYRASPGNRVARARIINAPHRADRSVSVIIKSSCLFIVSRMDPIITKYHDNQIKKRIFVQRPA